MSNFPLQTDLIGALTTPLMSRIREKYGRLILLLAAAFSGALMVLSSWSDSFTFGARIQQSTHPVNLKFFLTSGVMAGIVQDFFLDGSSAVCLAL